MIIINQKCLLLENNAQGQSFFIGFTSQEFHLNDRFINGISIIRSIEYPLTVTWVFGRKYFLLYVVVSELDSRSKGLGFESHPIPDVNGFKAMPGSIHVPSPGQVITK